MSFDTTALETQLKAIRDERRLAANTATRIGEALLALMGYAGDGPYLRKDREDSTSFLLRLLAGAIIGDDAIKLNADGSIVCGNIKVNGSAIFQELVFNHQNILEGDTYFTDRATVEKVTLSNNSTFILTLRKEYDDEQITFHVNDVCRMVVNNLDSARTVKTSWYRVESVDNENSQITVTLYGNDEVPGGQNYVPSEGGKMVRWGNSIDEDRQSCFFISSNDGRLLFLQGVVKPIIDDSNYSCFLGIPPELEMFKDKPINTKHPYLYARGIIMQDVITMDYEGNPEYKSRDMGYWNSGTQYIRGYDETAKGYFQDRVWYGGCLWACIVEKATIGKAPRWNNTEWTCLVGGKNMSMEVESSEGDWFRAGSSWSTVLTALLYNAEMQLTDEEIGLSYIYWTRSSDDAAGDTAWNNNHGKGKDGFTLSISSDSDLPSTWGAGSKVSFICTVEIPDGDTYQAGYVID